MKIRVDTDFDHFKLGLLSQVIEIFPNIYHDNRGSFTEVFKADSATYNPFNEMFNDGNYIMSTFDWVKQVNRSTSVPFVCRGLHAQSRRYCQSKLVECVSGIVYDIILDARPASKTFRKMKVYKLDSNKANKLFVPEGFLHGFISGESGQTENIFQYFCGGSVYHKDAEINVSVLSVLKQQKLIFTDDQGIEKVKIPLQKDENDNTLNDVIFNYSDLIFSDKDLNGDDITTWSQKIQEDYEWYHD